MCLARSQGVIMGCKEQSKECSLISSHAVRRTYARYTLQCPQRRARPVYLARGDSGRDKETKRQVTSDQLTIPRVKSDQWNPTAQLQTEQQRNQHRGNSRFMFTV